MSPTPKTMREAILLGLRDAARQGLSDPTAVIENHVRDFAAQKFGQFTLDPCPEVAEKSSQLWRALAFARGHRG